jgi:hypothetical protein
MWYGVLQFIPVSILIWIATAVTLAVGVYCKQSNSVHFAHIWISTVKFFATGIAIICCLRFYSKHKAKLLKHSILLKLFTFKSIIGLNALQSVSEHTIHTHVDNERSTILTLWQFIISILTGQNVLKSTKYMTYHDINTGLPSLILACEMPIFSILLILAFPVTPYKSDTPAAGPLSAIFDALNITDLLSMFVRGPMRLVKEQQRQISVQDRFKTTRSATPLMSEDERSDQERVKEPLVGTTV